MANLYDERGRQIMEGDVLKVFHFTGARRKRHYMYKQARETVMLGSSDPKPFLKISHLNRADEHYHEREDGRALEGYEIVQSGSDDLERRARLSDWVARTALAARDEINGCT